MEKKTKEITIVRYRRTIKRSQTIAIETCPLCGSQELISMAMAALLTGLSRSTLYEGIASQKVHSIRIANSELRICCQSLSAWMGVSIHSKKQMTFKQ